MMTYCFDTSAIIEITHDGANARTFAKALAKAEKVVISAISIYEVARYTRHVADEAATREILTFLYQYHIAPVLPDLAENAALLGAKHKLAMADAIIYATALEHHAALWTQDEDFAGLSHVRYYPKKKS